MTTDQRRKPNQSTAVIIGLGTMWIILALAIVYIEYINQPKIDIEWETETEINTAGFNIYRSDTAEGEFVRINDRIIPSQTDAVSGATYTFTDNNVERGIVYYYRLEDVEYDNSTQLHEVLTGEVASLGWLAVPLSLLSGIVGIIMLVSGFRQRR